MIGYYPFAYPESCVYDATTRMFGPYYGIDEEAGTGMAAGPLASYIYHVDNQKTSFLIGQGKYISPPSPSLIRVDLETDKEGINRLLVGGSSYISGEKLVEIG